MAGEETESVGGISIEASISNQLGGLAALEATLKAEATRLSGSFVINPTIGNLSTQVQQQNQQARRAAQQAPPIAFKAAALPTPSFSGRSSGAIELINKKLAETGEILDELTGEPVPIASIQRATRATQALASATSDVQQPTITPTIDESALAGQSGELVAQLKTIAERLSAAFVITPSVAPVPEAEIAAATKAAQAPQAARPPRPPRRPPTSVGAGEEGEEEAPKPRRKKLVAKDIGTEAEERIYTFEPEPEKEAQQAAKAARARELAAAQHLRQRGAAPSVAEEQFVAALQTAQTEPRFSPEMDRELRELSYENEQQGGAGRTSASLVGRQRSEAEIAALRAREAQRANAAATAPGRRPAEEQAALTARLERQNRQFVSGRASQAADEAAQVAGATRGRGAGAGRATALTSEDLERRAGQQIAVSEAQRLTAARTARTFASGLGGFLPFLGQTRQQTEATVNLRKAEQELTISRRRLSDPEVRGNTRAYAHAQEEVATATSKVAVATEKVREFTGGVSAARTLASVTIAGAAFGLGLQAIDFAVSALTPALGDAVDQMLGFSATSNKVTTDLGKQTQATYGNVDAVLAQTEAQAGLSATAADAINTQLRLATQIKAGAQNAATAGGLFRAAIGVGGGAQQGLLGGFGGIGGGGLLAQQLGGGAGLAETIESSFRDVTRAMTQAEGVQRTTSGLIVTPFNQGGPGVAPPAIAPPSEEQRARVAELGKQRQALESTYNEAAERGAASLGVLQNEVVHFAQLLPAQAQAIRDSNLPDELKNLALKSNEGLFDAQGRLVESYDQAIKGLNQVGAGLSIPDVATFGRIALEQERQRQKFAPAEIPAIQLRQAFERPAIQAAAERQQQFTLQVELPAQQALQNLAQPLLPVGTGIAAQDQASVAEGLQKSQGLQDDLNAGYEKGRQILATTYQVPLALLNQIKSVGVEIAGLQAGIANQQANYQVAQFNFQLHIARRTLSDIGGLTGKNFGAGQSYLGVLERQNLALSRQAQLLSFSLAQRQINFQQALAGFQAPGVTPEERQANVKQAQIEADFAQKQLDIQRQMFGNQVQIVDIGNLRQGADLAAQIGLLLQGRQLTIDAAQASEQIALLQAQSQQLVAQAGTYLTKINNLTGVAFSQIQQLETAAGKAMVGIATSVLSQFGIFIQGVNGYVNQIGQQTSEDKGGGGKRAGNYASGAIFSASQPTSAIFGEAGDETVAILRNARPGQIGLGGGGGDVSIVFGDIYVRNDSDIDRIAQAVMAAMGQRASLVGLRLTG